MKKRLIILMLVLAVAASLFAGCKKETQQDTPTATEQIEATEEATTEPTEEVTAEPEATEEDDAQLEVETVTDVLGNELELPTEVPTKIVSLTPSNTEILFALGLGEYVIGVDSYSDYPEEALEIEKVGDYNGPNVEAILALEPDVVFAGNSLQADAITQLQDVGIKVVAAEATTYEEIFDSIRLVGQLTCTEEKADEVIALMKEKESQVVAMAQEYEGESITAYYVLGAGEYGNWTAGPGSLIDDMFKLLGIETITDVDGATAWMEFSLETLVAEDPDIIVLPESEYLTMEALCEMDGYKELTACKEGKVMLVNESMTQRPSVRIVDGLEEIYNAVYGD